MKSEPRCSHTPPKPGETPSTLSACAASGGAGFTARCAARWLWHSSGAGKPRTACCCCPASPSSSLSPVSTNYKVPNTIEMYKNTAEIHRSALLKHTACFSLAELLGKWLFMSVRASVMGMISGHVTVCVNSSSLFEWFYWQRRLGRPSCAQTQWRAEGCAEVGGPLPISLTE